MTSYPLEVFGSMATRCGLTPRWIHRVPRDEVGRRYAYVLMQNTRRGPHERLDPTLSCARPPRNADSCPGRLPGCTPAPGLRGR